MELMLGLVCFGISVSLCHNIYLGCSDYSRKSLAALEMQVYDMQSGPSNLTGSPISDPNLKAVRIGSNRRPSHLHSFLSAS